MEMLFNDANVNVEKLNTLVDLLTNYLKAEIDEKTLNTGLTRDETEEILNASWYSVRSLILANKLQTKKTRNGYVITKESLLKLCAMLCADKQLIKPYVSKLNENERERQKTKQLLQNNQEQKQIEKAPTNSIEQQTAKTEQPPVKPTEQKSDNLKRTPVKPPEQKTPKIDGTLLVLTPPPEELTEPPAPEGELIDMKAAVELTKISASTIGQSIRNGEITAWWEKKLKGTRKYVMRKSDVEEWAKRQVLKAKDPIVWERVKPETHQEK